LPVAVGTPSCFVDASGLNITVIFGESLTMEHAMKTESLFSCSGLTKLVILCAKLEMAGEELKNELLSSKKISS